MIVGHGIDVTDIARIRCLLAEMREDFLIGTFTPAERSLSAEGHEFAPYLAGRLAAKEAIVKALGTGFSGDLSWQHVEVARDPHGRPDVRLSGAAKAVADGLGIARWFLSISHTDEVAIASAIAVAG